MFKLFLLPKVGKDTIPLHSDKTSTSTYAIRGVNSQQMKVDGKTSNCQVKCHSPTPISSLPKTKATGDELLEIGASHMQIAVSVVSTP